MTSRELWTGSLWAAVDVPMSQRSPRQMQTIRMPRGHSIDKCDLVRVSHMMLGPVESRKALSRANTISVTLSPGQPVDSWPETQIIKICHSPIFSCQTVPRSSHGIIVHCQSLMSISRLDSIPSGLRIVPRRYPGVLSRSRVSRTSDS